MYKINTRVNYQQKFGIPVPNIEKFKDPSIPQWMGTSTKLQRWRVDKRYRNCEVLIHCCRNRFDLREMLQEEREIYCKLKTINAKETKERGIDCIIIHFVALLLAGVLYKLQYCTPSQPNTMMCASTNSRYSIPFHPTTTTLSTHPNFPHPHQHFVTRQPCP